jgi:pimeloyl-ACP methyl ester carboxylesterase
MRVGDMPQIELSQGTIHYRDEGSGPAIVLVHGLLVNGRVWERLVPLLSASSRVIVPDLPLGSHPAGMDPGADLSPPGLAALIAELIQKLDLDDVTLVGNDTGGALCQLVVTGHPERIGQLVLINCDAFEHFPPAPFSALVKVLGRVPGAVAMLAAGGRLAGVRRRAMSLAPLTIDPVPDELLKSWISPLRARPVRRDLIKVLRGISPRYTVQAAEQLPNFDRPVLIAWGTEDKFFPFGDAQRLAALFPRVRLERIERARTFVQMDAPDRLAALIQGG